MSVFNMINPLQASKYINEAMFSAVVKCHLTLDGLFSSINSIVIQQLLIIVIGLSMILKVDIFHLLHLIEISSEALEMKSVFNISKLEQQINYGIITYIYYLITGKGIKKQCVQ